MKVSPVHILLVEDNEDDYLIVRDLIEYDLMARSDSECFCVVWAASYQEGLAAQARTPFDVVLVDHGLPPYTGLEFLQAAQESGCEAPIILLTGRSDYALDVEAMQAGAADFLIKTGLNAALLERTIRYAVERKRAAVAEQESQRLLQMTLDTLGSSIAVLDHEGNVITTNKAWQRFTEENGCHTGHCGIGVNYLETCEAATGDWAQEAAVVVRGIREVIAGQREEFYLDYPCHSLEQQRWFSLRVTRFMAEGAVRVVTAHEEITERKLAEAALRESEARFQGIVANAPGVVYQFVLQADGAVEFPFVSEGCRDLYGMEPDEIQRTPHLILDAVCESDRPEFDYLTMESAQDLTPWRWEGRIKTPAGKVKWIQGMARPQRLANGGTLWDGLLVDVTSRKELEAELDRFFTLSLDMLAISDANGYYKHLNQAFETTLGYSREELMARPHLDFVHPEDRDATAKVLASLASSTRTANFVNRYFCRDGSYRWLLWAVAPFEDVVYAVAHDITKLKKAEGALQKANDELELRVMERTSEWEAANRELQVAKQEAEAANEAKSEFLSRMSHELRTPLNAILGFGQILGEEELPDIQQESVHYILKGGRHLLGLINEILDIARVESGHVELSIEPIDLKELVTECCALMKPASIQAGIPLMANSCEAESLLVMADRQRLKQVLINLLANAIKYNRPHGKVEISCCRNSNQNIEIAVRDTGEGITPADLSKLFMPFERLGAARSGIEGTGLGLVLSKSLVMAMNGTLDVRSTVGEGSVFSVEFTEAPYTVSLTTDLLGRNQNYGLGSLSEHRYKILCVEDNVSNLRLLEMVLRNRPGVTLLSAMQGGVGLDLARQHEPDLILLDLNLPDISGKEVLQRLQQSAATRDIPVVIISADATPSLVEDLLRAGAQTYLTKPLDVKNFLETLDELLLSKKENVLVEQCQQ